MKTFKGAFFGKDLKIAIVASRFNELITDKLLDGALDSLKMHGVKDDDIEVYWVPGAFELPQVVERVVNKENDAVVVLGAVIRGETPHFDYIAGEVAKGVAQISIKAEKPVIFGVLTVDDMDQAFARAGVKSNKGAEAAVAAIEMANLLKEI